MDHHQSSTIPISSDLIRSHLDDPLLPRYLSTRYQTLFHSYSHELFAWRVSPMTIFTHNSLFIFIYLFSMLIYFIKLSYTSLDRGSFASIDFFVSSFFLLSRFGVFCPLRPLKTGRTLSKYTKYTKLCFLCSCQEPLTFALILKFSFLLPISFCRK